MNSKNLSFSVYYLLVVISFSLPFGRKFTSPLLILLFATFFIFALISAKQLVRSLLEKRNRAFLLLPAGYYVLCIIGLLYTSNLKEGFYELDKKITLAAFPVLFLFFQRELTLAQLNNILKSFLAGVIVCGLISIGLGFYHSTNIVHGVVTFRTAVNDFVYERGDSFFEQVTQGGNYFFGTYISPFIHTNYYGLYLSLGCFIAVYFFFVSIKKYRYLISGFFLFCVLVLCDSRGPLIAFLLTIPVVVVLGVQKRLFKMALPFLIVAILLILSISPRTSLLFADLKHTMENVDYDSKESTMLRLVVWDSALDIIKENWLFGVGTGDREDAMLSFTESRNKAAFEMKLNAHNQYLESFMTFGILGLGMMIVLLIAPLVHAFVNRDNLFAAFQMIIGFNMLFESILQVFQGIVFFSFFYCLFVLRSHQQLNNSPNENLTSS